MIALQLKGTVHLDGTLVVKLPVTVNPGDYEIVVVLPFEPQQEEDGKEATPETRKLEFSAYPAGLVDDAFTFRRETDYRDEP